MDNEKNNARAQDHDHAHDDSHARASFLISVQLRNLETKKKVLKINLDQFSHLYKANLHYVMKESSSSNKGKNM